MADKPTPKSNPDQPLKNFIKAGGRPNAESDFTRILKRAAPPAHPKKPEKSE